MAALIKKLALITIQIAVFVLISKAGYAFVDALQLPLPGNLAGMLMLFALLTSGVIRLEWVEAGASLLVRHLAFFFIPTAVGLFATATPLHGEFNDGSGSPPMKLPLGQPFLVRNIFADFKRHDLGPNFHERNFDSTLTTQFMTAPLWGVGSTYPYGHDGRSINLAEVILRHGGEAQGSRDAFAQLSDASQAAVLRFLESLMLFPPDDTASNLDPGSISLRVLFNDVNDLE
jgi:putative effector of murein hydrolase LrgA (UPF0299 family)